MQTNETTNLILVNETHQRWINNANSARNAARPQQQQQQQNEDGNSAQQIVQQNHHTMQAHMTGRGQLTTDGYVPEAAQNGTIIML